jgi:DNA-binding NarL/FixJ family response regulator
MGLRIAIFDDNKNIRESISLLLATVPSLTWLDPFCHVLDCIDDIKDSKPDIVLMDIEMPGMTGIEAVTKIKKEYPAHTGIDANGF